MTAPASVGLRHMAVAALFFSLMSLLVKTAGQRLPVEEIVLARALITFGLTWAYLARRRNSPGGTRRTVLLLRGALGFGALLCFFYSVVHLPLADATVIQYTNPVFASLIAALVIGERLRVRDGAYISASLAGVLLVARPSFLFGANPHELAPLAVGVALLGALLSAAAYVSVRALTKTEEPLVIVFYFAVVSVAGSIPLAALDPVWPTGMEWLVLAGVGVATQLGQVYLTKGLREEPAGRALAVGYLQIIFAGGWGLLFFAEVPGPLSAAGFLLIAASIAMLARKPGARSRTLAGRADQSVSP
ncbi:MAG: DMT family transporter [Gemmatimonadales bacterium]